MTDLENILPMWHKLESSASDYVLATVVEVDGPSYRKPGARMLIAADGQRVGTVSGGCLEAEVAEARVVANVIRAACRALFHGRRRWRHAVRFRLWRGFCISSSERRATASSLLKSLEAAFHARVPLAIATVLEGAKLANRVFAGPSVQNVESWRPALGALLRSLPISRRKQWNGCNRAISA